MRILLVSLLLSSVYANSLWFLNHMQYAASGTSADMSISHNHLNDARIMCAELAQLSNRQREICERKPDVVKVLYGGMQAAINECRHQFARERWNCTVHDKSGVLLKLGSREAAYVYAITSAGVVGSVARECSRGTLQGCGCAPLNNYGVAKDNHGKLFRWGGCGDNVKFAASFARRFLDHGEKAGVGDDILAKGRVLVNLHNNRAGRKAIRTTERLQCKCHGVSGACTTRTCWRAVNDLHYIGAYLRHKYERALQVTINENKLLPAAVAPKMARRYDSSAILSPSYDRRYNRYTRSGLGLVAQAIDSSDLVFVEPSPDYCDHDHDAGSMGTGGRECNATHSMVADSCDKLCCGRGYDTRVEIRVEKCNCRFVWCCEVKCEQCTRLAQVHTCKGAGANARLLDDLRSPALFNSLLYDDDHEAGADEEDYVTSIYSKLRANFI